MRTTDDLPYILAVDFDGTIVEGCYPHIGRDLGALFWLSQFKVAGALMILWTCRTGIELQKAHRWLHEHGYGGMFNTVNEEVHQIAELFDECGRKVFAHEYLDDRGHGAPMVQSCGTPDQRELVDVGFDWNVAGSRVLTNIKRHNAVREAREEQRNAL